ncbi:MAG: flagellar MS ring protein [Candidatus Scalindua rubra]|uniref:Flagellar M-ring protein n=1 Tax=Candidatus Scalindua rubra TaxID=1872076 RepID=A0A1E3X3U7_9BACT|nr:MAG: flagellar MS ring protein [Candidatus Scalindua rubra]
MEQMGNVWKGTSFGQRLIVIIVVMGFGFGFFTLTYWVREPEYGLLYGDLGQKEAAEIVGYLRDSNINYKIKDNGSTILAPSNMIYELRMNLAKNSMPRGDVGFELFDKIKFGMSDLAQRVNYRRALQGELSKTIAQLDGVEWARVQIVIPEPSLFVEDEKPSTASVILKMRKRNGLNDAQIAGISHLVSTSVEGLSTENITITDSMGNLLSNTGSSKLTGIVSNQLDLRRKIENYYASKATSLVEKITGPGKTIVKVSADLDFKHVDEKQIEYDQDNKVPINQTITSQSTEMPQAAGGGEGVGQLSKESEETETTNYALSKVERAISEHVASIKRLTVAILVDGNYEEEEMEDGKINRKFIARPDEELNQIASIVKQSIGLDESPPRNDRFEIQCVQFQGQVPVFIDEEGVEKENKKEFILAIAKNSSLVIAVIAFLLFAMKALKRLLVSQQTGGYATYSQRELQDGYQTNKVDEALQTKADEKRIAIRDDIIETTKNDPRTTGNLVRKWLREGGD